MIVRYDDDISAFLPMAENHLNLKKDWKSQNKMHSSSKIRKGSDNTF